jgi:hypothetical protein
MLRTEELALADQHVRGGVKAVILEPDERAAQKREAVEHLAAGEDGAPFAREVLVAAKLELFVRTTERAAKPRDAACALDDGEVEVAHVPSRQHVGIGGTNVRQEALEQRALVGDHLRAFHIAAADEQHALAARARHRDGVETTAVQARLDVEGENAQPRCEVRRRERRVAIDAAHPGLALEGPVHGEGAADAMVDQVAVGEAQIGLERVDAGVAQPVSHRGDVAR